MWHVTCLRETLPNQQICGIMEFKPEAPAESEPSRIPWTTASIHIGRFGCVHTQAYKQEISYCYRFFTLFAQLHPQLTHPLTGSLHPLYFFSSFHPWPQLRYSLTPEHTLVVFWKKPDNQNGQQVKTFQPGLGVHPLIVPEHTTILGRR